MSESSNSQVRSKLIQIIEPSVSQITDAHISNFVKLSNEIAQIRHMSGDNSSPLNISSNTFSIFSAKDNFVWGKSTWGVDTVGRNKIIQEGEFNPSTRYGVLKREEFRQ